MRKSGERGREEKSFWTFFACLIGRWCAVHVGMKFYFIHIFPFDSSTKCSYSVEPSSSSFSHRFVVTFTDNIDDVQFSFSFCVLFVYLFLTFLYIIILRRRRNKHFVHRLESENIDFESESSCTYERVREKNPAKREKGEMKNFHIKKHFSLSYVSAIAQAYTQTADTHICCIHVKWIWMERFREIKKSQVCGTNGEHCVL